MPKKKATRTETPAKAAAPKRPDLGSPELTCECLIAETIAAWPLDARMPWYGPHRLEMPIVALIKAYGVLADVHREETGRTLGNDPEFGESARDLMRAMLEAIWLGTGRLDNYALQVLLDDLAEHTDAQVGED